MAPPGDGFRFPASMPREAAEAILQEAYHELDTGKLLRRALKRQREQGLDPPGDVQYVAEARVEEDADGGLGVSLATDILLYDEFEGMDACVDAFEDVLSAALLERVEQKVAKWLRKNPPAPGPS